MTSILIAYPIDSASLILGTKRINVNCLLIDLFSADKLSTEADTGYKPNLNKHKILCNSVKTSVIREKIYIKIDILELSRIFYNILEDSRPF